MNKNSLFNFLLVLSLTFQVSASVNEIKEKKSYFNFTEETIERVNKWRNRISFCMTPFIFAYLSEYCQSNSEFNQLKWPIGFISIACTASCYLIGKPASEQPLPRVKREYAIDSWDKEILKHYAKNPPLGEYY